VLGSFLREIKQKGMGMGFGFWQAKVTPSVEDKKEVAMEGVFYAVLNAPMRETSRGTESIIKDKQATTFDVTEKVREIGHQRALAISLIRDERLPEYVEHKLHGDELHETNNLKTLLIRKMQEFCPQNEGAEPSYREKDAYAKRMMDIIDAAIDWPEKFIPSEKTVSR